MANSKNDNLQGSLALMILKSLEQGAMHRWWITLHIHCISNEILRVEEGSLFPAGRAVVTIIGVVAELERNLIIERVRAGMRRAKLEGRHIGRQPLTLDREAILCDRRRGLSLRQIAKAHCISRATVHRVVHAQPSPENAA